MNKPFAEFNKMICRLMEGIIYLSLTLSNIPDFKKILKQFKITYQRFHFVIR